MLEAPLVLTVQPTVLTVSAQPPVLDVTLDFSLVITTETPIVRLQIASVQRDP